jgi:hypothetical protein
VNSIPARSPRLCIRGLFGLAALFVCVPAPLAWAQGLPTPPDQGAPTGRQRGGASRGNCLEYQNLTALVPVVEGTVWSQTNSPTPEFFFYVPQALTADMPLELVVQDRQDNYIFQRQFSVEAPAGILAIPITPQSPGLNPDEAYFWTFSVYCDPMQPSASVSVFGTIKRIADSRVMTSGHRLSPAQQLDLARQYMEAGLWHEALALTLSLPPNERHTTAYLETLAALFEYAGIADISPAVPVTEVPE